MEDAIDAIQAMMDERGLTRRDIFPSKSRASEYMNRRRPLTIEMIRKLHFEFGISAEVLIAPYKNSESE